MDLAETSMITIGLALVAFLGFSLYAIGTRATSVVSTQQPAASPVSIFTASTSAVEIICKNGYEPPLCLAGMFDNSDDITYPGNGSARPAVAKDTFPGYGEVHRAAYVNDGLYGPGASWVSASPNSWIKIDLGQKTAFNAISFGRDRLGRLNDRDPGQFVISVAVSDNIYADGNSSYDELEYVQIYDSEQAGFDGDISGPETVMAYFDLLVARFIKITFENAGTAIDEVEAFVVPTVLANDPTKTPREPAAHTLTPTDSPTPWPTSTPIPTDTPLPTDTATPVPTNTPLPTDTSIPTETATPIPTETALPTDVYYPFATPMPILTSTSTVASTP